MLRFSQYADFVLRQKTSILFRVFCLLTMSGGLLSDAYAQTCQTSIDALSEQRRLQTILDADQSNYSISAMLNGHGELGRVLARYLQVTAELESLSLDDNFENIPIPRETDGLDDVVTHRVINTLLKNTTHKDDSEILGVYNQVSELNYQHCIFDEANDLFWSVVSSEALSMRQTDVWQKQRLVQSLRRVARSGVFAPYADQYLDILGGPSLPKFIYNEEIEYWNDVLEGKICEDISDSSCLQVLARQLAELEVVDPQPVLDRYVCDIKLIYKEQLYEFHVC